MSYDVVLYGCKINISSFTIILHFSCVWWWTLVIQHLRQKQVDFLEFKGSLGFYVRPCLEQNLKISWREGSKI